ncbi:MAG: right-handed parallel beta-helix repeat-containing protein [Abditibacteriota bacterium]|nr:right-handed parallel beta-helix repeat-containing protein [Abditibacteriota bacterium]
MGLGVAAVSALNEVNAWDGTPDPVKTGGLLSEEYLSEDIRITGCRADCGREDLGAAAGIVIEYSRRFFVENCSVGSCSQGIEFWGGDSDYSRGGRKENFHAAQKGVIKNCSVADAAGGGIWGSLGQDIRIINCSVSRCLDVGIDFEGCRRALAEGCRAEDCANGNYSTFQYCTEDVVFKNCRSYISGELGATHFFNSNATQMAADQEIVITGCRFESRGPSRITAFSAMKSFCFLNNTCVNAALDTSGNNICSVRAEGNRFIINTPLPESAPSALFAETLCPGRSEIVVKNNDVSGSSEQTGILVSVLSPGGGRAVLENNRVSGCEPPLRVRSSAPVSVEGDYSGAVEKYPPAGG